MIGVIIVNPNNRNPSPTSAIEPPIWCAYYADYYHDTTILDAEMEGLTVAETDERIGESPAILVAMGANPSVSSTPKMDVVERLMAGHPWRLPVGLHPNATSQAFPLGDASPQWDGVDFSKYRPHNWHLFTSNGGNYGVVYTSFGCPFNCSYCNIHSLYGTRKVEFRDPQKVIEEIGYLVDRGVRDLKIADELFVLNQKHVNKICDLIIEKDWGLNIWAYARVDTVTPEILKKLKRAGVNWLAYGFESACERVRDGVNKHQDPDEAIRITREAGINIIGNFIFGLPDDDLESMEETLDWAKEQNFEYVNFYCAQAYPGSELYSGNTDWDSYDQMGDLKPLETKYLTSEEVLKFRDKAFREYFNREDYLRMISKFGVVDQIHKMLEWSPR